MTITISPTSFSLTCWWRKNNGQIPLLVLPGSAGKRPFVLYLKAALPRAEKQRGKADADHAPNTYRCFFGRIRPFGNGGHGDKNKRQYAQPAHINKWHYPPAFVKPGIFQAKDIFIGQAQRVRGPFSFINSVLFRSTNTFNDPHDRVGFYTARNFQNRIITRNNGAAIAPIRCKYCVITVLGQLPAPARLASFL